MDLVATADAAGAAAAVACDDAASDAAEPLPPLHQPARLVVLGFLDVAGIGRWANCSRAAAQDAAVDLVWADAYDRTYRVSGSVREDVQAWIARPFGQDAVGSRVSVYMPVRNVHACGVVQAYDPRTNAYLVRYDEPGPDGKREVWELEARSDPAVRLQPILASFSRIRFLDAPGGGAAAASERCEVATETLFASSGKVMRFPTWRQEFRHTSESTPSRLQQRLVDHHDEVLFLAFSPCGSYLATCSRDCTTCIYRFVAPTSKGVARESAPSMTPQLQRRLQHSSAATFIQWWPEAPHRRIVVSTAGPSQPQAEVWDVVTGARLVRARLTVRDVYATFMRWPPSTGAVALMLNQHMCVEGSCFVQDLDLFRIVEPLDVAPPRQASAAAAAVLEPLARLRLRNRVNYFHCGLPAPPSCPRGPSSFVALTGTLPRQCDAVAVFELPESASRQGGPIAGKTAEAAEGTPEAPVVELTPRCKVMPSRAVLGLGWARGNGGQGLLLANTRPRLHLKAPPPAGDETLFQLHRRPAPPLGTAIELVVLDAATLETLSIHGGHHAFTTAEAPFVLYAEAWAKGDVVASGGEDSCVHVWHRCQGRQLKRLDGHTQVVNAVGWCEEQRLLASASDDQSVILWSCGRAPP